MQAVILAAGEGQRMRPLTYTKPKVMLPVANKPILEHLLSNLGKAGVDEAIFVVGYKDEVVREYFGEGRCGVRVRYVTQRKQLGTADALKAASHLLKDDFLMLNGDNIVGWEDIERICSANGCALAVREVSNPEDFGVVELEDGGWVRNIVEKPEKPQSNLINAGVYKFDPDFLSYLEKTPISKRGEYEITDTIRLAVEDGVRFEAVRVERWIDVGYPWDLLKANEIILNEMDGMTVEGEVEEGAVIKGKVAIGKNSVVRSGSYVIGPVVIGENCVVGPNTFIRPFTSIGDGCHIGSFVEVKNSIVMRNTNIPHLNYVGDSVIGENCNFGAGTKVANLRLDEREVKAMVRGRKISTGRRKFGAVVGDNVKTGINVSINVGAMIGCNVTISPSKFVDGYVEPNTML